MSDVVQSAFGPPEIRTQRLLLRAVRDGDASAIAEVLSDWQVTRNLAPVPYPYGPADALEFLPTLRAEEKAGRTHAWAIDIGGFAGSIALGRKADEPADARILGYHLAREYWGKGYVTEAGKAVVDFAFETLGLAALRSNHAVDNPASGRVLVKLGFELTGEGEAFYKPRGQMVPRLNYELTRAAWEAAR